LTSALSPVDGPPLVVGGTVVVATVVDVLVVDVLDDVVVELFAAAAGEGADFTVETARALLAGGLSTLSMAALTPTAATTSTTMAAVTAAGVTLENMRLTRRAIADAMRRGSGWVT
jgi:hypothetical protein